MRKSHRGPLTTLWALSHGRRSAHVSFQSTWRAAYAVDHGRLRAGERGLSPDVVRTIQHIEHGTAVGYSMFRATHDDCPPVSAKTRRVIRCLLAVKHSISGLCFCAKDEEISRSPIFWLLCFHIYLASYLGCYSTLERTKGGPCTWVGVISLWFWFSYDTFFCLFLFLCTVRYLLGKSEQK